MMIVYQLKPTEDKRVEIKKELKGYWENDVWDVKDSFFDQFRTECHIYQKRYLRFDRFPTPIKEEIKFYLAYRLKTREIRLQTAGNYYTGFRLLAGFLDHYYPKIQSIVDIPPDKGKLQWLTFLRKNSVNPASSKIYMFSLNQLCCFVEQFYDERDEFEKDEWDWRKIPGVTLPVTQSQYRLDFKCIPLPFRPLVKRYVKYRIAASISCSQCATDLMSIRLFLSFIHKCHPKWEDLRRLSRNDMEEYLSWYRYYTKKMKAINRRYLLCLRWFLQQIQMAQYPEAPEAHIQLLIFKEDLPKAYMVSENNIKYIPEGVLQQLDDHMDKLRPPEYIPVVILLRETGWRISDILNLKYDTCVQRTPQGWFLNGDITKTKVLNHRVPITNEVAAMVKAVAEETKAKSAPDNNPNKYVFIRFDGIRKGRPPQPGTIQDALNRLAKNYDIVDDEGHVFYFKNHAFRHTKGVELINNGMNILHVQKWLAHVSPQMTQLYAKILDETMRKSWEEIKKKGIFRLDKSGSFKKIDLSEIEDEDLIEWEYIRHNLDAVSMPLGYCLKPKKLECKTQLNPCLSCRNLCTTPDFIPQFEFEIQETKALIERGKEQGRIHWVEKNQALLDRLESVLTMLKYGKIHHKAGKKGREYIGEERNGL